jgi:hypothetical protein
MTNRLRRFTDRVVLDYRFLPALAAATVVCLAMAAWAVFGVLAIDNQRERDRIVSDIASCERVNVLRGQVNDGFTATADAFDRTFEVTIPYPDGTNPERDARITAVRTELADVLADLHAVIDSIEPVDCVDAVPGSKPTNTTTTEDNP